MVLIFKKEDFEKKNREERKSALGREGEVLRLFWGKNELQYRETSIKKSREGTRSLASQQENDKRKGGKRRGSLLYVSLKKGKKKKTVVYCWKRLG